MLEHAERWDSSSHCGASSCLPLRRNHCRHAGMAEGSCLGRAGVGVHLAQAQEGGDAPGGAPRYV